MVTWVYKTKINFSLENIQPLLFQFVRADYKTPMRSMQILLRSIWKLKRPNLLISITGGARKLTLNPKINQAFKEGLFRVATSTGKMSVDMKATVKSNLL